LDKAHCSVGKAARRSNKLLSEIINFVETDRSFWDFEKTREDSEGFRCCPTDLAVGLFVTRQGVPGGSTALPDRFLKLSGCDFPSHRM
jgi:hypothetical protein